MDQKSVLNVYDCDSNRESAGKMLPACDLHLPVNLPMTKGFHEKVIRPKRLRTRNTQ